jgi:excisionase family DNA binding protein
MSGSKNLERSGSNASGGGRRGLPRLADIGGRLCVTVPEAAKMLGISRNYAYELVRIGVIPSIRFGKRILIPKAALLKMLEEGVKQ